jgi:RNA recognition motif-containing protein
MGKRVFVGNLPWGFTSSDLESLFAEFGTVVSAQIITDRETGRSRGFGFVELDSAQAAARAIQGLNSKDLEGRPLKVNEAHERPRTGGGSGGYRDSYGGGGYGGGYDRGGRSGGDGGRGRQGRGQGERGGRSGGHRR